MVLGAARVNHDRADHTDADASAYSAARILSRRSAGHRAPQPQPPTGMPSKLRMSKRQQDPRHLAAIAQAEALAKGLKETAHWLMWHG